MALKPRRRRRTVDQVWHFDSMTICDIVCFRSGSTNGDRINSEAALRAARAFHGVDHIDRLTVEDRRRLWPDRHWT